MTTLNTWILVTLALGGCTPVTPAPMRGPEVASVRTVSDATTIASPAPVRPRISLVDIVKRVVPDATSISLYEAAAKPVLGAQFARAGITTQAAKLPHEPVSIPCDRNNDDDSRVQVVDLGRSMNLCPLRGEDHVRIARWPYREGDLIPPRTFIDPQCNETCDAYTIDATSGERSFVALDFPLVPAHSNLTFAIGSQDRTAVGLLVTTPAGKLAVDLAADDGGSGTTRLLLEGVEPSVFGSKTMTKGHAVLEGWVRSKGAQHATPSPQLVRVTGTVRLHGYLRLVGTGVVDSNELPAMFAPMTSAGTLGTMNVTHIDNVVDAAALAALDAKDDAAWKKATVKIRTGDVAGAIAPLEEAHAAMAVVFGKGSEMGRAACLAVLLKGLPTAKDDRAFRLARAYVHLRTQTRVSNGTPSQEAFLHALFLRTTEELGVIAEGPTDGARHAAVMMVRIWIEGRETPIAIHDRIARRFQITELDTYGPIEIL